MNLFVIGWNLPKERHPIAVAELRHMTEVYPHLDPGTLWHHTSPSGTLFSASIHTAGRLAVPRRYVAQRDGQFVFYSGLPVDPSGVHHAHRAEVLSAHWDQLVQDLEGQYLIVRATDDPLRLELMTDFLGLEQVYYRREGDTWLISNSVLLTERISEPSALDPLGASLFLTGKELAADHTLRRNIHVIPGGQHWIWQGDDAEPRQHSHYAPSELARRPRRALTQSDFKRLADDLIGLCRSLSQGFGEIKCPLTGGRDSRLVAALLIQAGVPAQYYTAGDPSSEDVQIGTLIAQTFDLPHEITTVESPDIVGKWDELCWRFVRQSEGMTSLWEMATVLELDAPIDRLGLSLWGMGGEIARGRYCEPHFFLTGRNLAGAQRFLAEQRINNSSGLFRQEGVELTRDYVYRFAEQCVDEGWEPVDVPDVFFSFERVGRFGGIGARRTMPIGDVLAPLCSRPFIEATFAMPALQRYTEPLHYGLTRMLMPELHSLPCDKGPWRSQRPVLNWLSLYKSSVLHDARGKARRLVPDTLRRLKPKKSRKKLHTFDQGDWFEIKREQVREVCLDQRDSMLWNLVDRSEFERMMSSATDREERASYKGTLFRIATLFYYEADHEQHAAPATAQS